MSGAFCSVRARASLTPPGGPRTTARARGVAFLSAHPSLTIPDAPTATPTDAPPRRPAVASSSSSHQYVRVGQVRDLGKSETWGNKDAADDAKVLVRCLECQAEWNESTL